MKKLTLVILATLLSVGAMAQLKNNTRSDRVAPSSSINKTPFSMVFLGGWDGLGDNMFGGLQAMDNAYGTNLWFNSWQIEAHYNLFSNSKMNFFLGVGYNSDAFKFCNEYVSLDPPAINGNPYEMHVADQTTLATMYGTNHNVDNPVLWQTRMVLRYVTIPVGINYKVNNVSFGLTLLPGFNYSSRYTGIKYKFDGEKQDDLRQDLRGHVRAAKFDVRLNVNFEGVGFFIQVSTLPALQKVDMNVYPFRMGFMLGV